MVDLDVLRGDVELVLYEVTEPGGGIIWDGSPGHVRSVLVYAENWVTAVQTVREMLGLADNERMQAQPVATPTLTGGW